MGFWFICHLLYVFLSIKYSPVKSNVYISSYVLMRSQGAGFTKIRNHGTITKDKYLHDSISKENPDAVGLGKWRNYYIPCRLY